MTDVFPTFGAIALAFGLFAAGVIFGMAWPAMSAVGNQPLLNAGEPTYSKAEAGGGLSTLRGCDQDNPFCPFARARGAEGLAARGERSELRF